MRWGCSLVLLALPLAGCVGGVAAPPAPPQSAPSGRLNKPLPSFQRPALDGTTVSTRVAAGKVTVVKFFAKYCQPCVEQLPAAQQLHRDNEDVRFIGIDVDEHAAEAAELVATYQLTFPVLHDGGFVLAETFQVTKLPATFVADSSGTVRWVGGAQQREGDLAAALAWVKHSELGRTHGDGTQREGAGDGQR